MRVVLIVALFALGWGALTGTANLPNLLLGAALGGGAIYLLSGRRERPAAFARLRRIASLAALFVYELMLSAIRVAAVVLSPNLRSAISPAIIAFPLTARSDWEITLLANLITLTPGTLSVDVSADRKRLYVHVLDCRDRGELVRSIAGGFERKVIEVFR